MCTVFLAIAACGGKPPPAPATPEPPRVVKPAAVVDDAPPLDRVIDDAHFIGANGAADEHLVIREGDDRWTFDADFTGPDQTGTAHIHEVIVTGHDGILLSGVFDIASGSGKHVAFTVERDGDDWLIVTDAGTKRTAAADLFAGAIGQLAAFCFLETPDEMSSFATSPYTIAGDVDMIGDVARIPFTTPNGVIDLYCDDDKVLGIDGPSPMIRQGAEDRFAKARRQPLPMPMLPEGVVERERTVEVAATDDVPAATLTCSLVAPEKARRAAAVALVPSGVKSDLDDDYMPEDRNKRHVARRLAYALGAAGIASLRCAARTDPTTITVATVSADGAAMIAALRKEKGIDKKRVGMYGSVASASCAPEVWKRAKPRALVVVDPLDHTLGDMMIASGKTQADQDAIRKAIERYRTGDAVSADVSPYMKSFVESADSFLRSTLDYDPAATAELVTSTSVLVIDTAFPRPSPMSLVTHDAALTAAAYGKATGKKKNTVEQKTYTDVDDSLRERLAGDEKHFAPWWAPVADPVLTDITTFFAAHL